MKDAPLRAGEVVSLGEGVSDCRVLPHNPRTRPSALTRDAAHPSSFILHPCSVPSSEEFQTRGARRRPETHTIRGMRLLTCAALAVLLVACKGETAVTDTVVADTREPISVMYVGAPELPVREQANEASPVIATYQNGEAVSVLAEKGEWTEVRTGDRSGWAKKAELTTAEGKEQAEEDPQPKFRVMPMPVSAPSAQGEIYIEADVNTDGDVTNIRILTNTTGSVALAEQNASALRSAKFHPIIQGNERRKFKYYHRVTY
jgi:hypothetical protein